MNHDFTIATQARRADRSALAGALADTRAHTLQHFQAFRRALGDANPRVPYRSELNPPLWEVGHIGWFQEWWLARNPQRGRGAACDPGAERAPSVLGNADLLYDSSNVPHASRWSLPLPAVQESLGYLDKTLAATLALLDDAADTDEALYFFRLALFHEDMHNEAAVYTAQNLGIAMDGVAEAMPSARGVTTVPAGTHVTGWPGAGFAFDNELAAHEVSLGAFEIDRAPVSNAQFMAFVEDAGYEQRRYWSDAGWAWRTQRQQSRPRYVPPQDGRWMRNTFGEMQELRPELPASNLSWHEAQAWCRWAGRRLPTEWEWEHAVLSTGLLDWGQVWEWTSSPFKPYPGFLPHPYRDYSAPWFGSHKVLRGASFATHARMKHPRYRNFFLPDRNDIFAGFRSCAL